MKLIAAYDIGGTKTELSIFKFETETEFDFFKALFENSAKN